MSTASRVQGAKVFSFLPASLQQRPLFEGATTIPTSAPLTNPSGINVHKRHQLYCLNSRLHHSLVPGRRLGPELEAAASPADAVALVAAFLTTAK